MSRLHAVSLSGFMSMTVVLTAMVTAMAAGVTVPRAATGKERPIRIVIDPGHGGNNMGAVGPYGVHEKYVTLSIADKLFKLLKNESDAIIFMTRKNDVYVSLTDRAEMANALEADLFLSIHCNAAVNTEANGIETFYFGKGSESSRELAERENGNEISHKTDGPDQSLYMLLEDMQFNGNQNESAVLASFVQKSLTRTFRRARNREVRQAPFTVLEKTDMPAVVIEAGFISHREEGRRLLMDDYQTMIAGAIRNAVVDFITSVREKPAFARQVTFD